MTRSLKLIATLVAVALLTLSGVVWWSRQGQVAAAAPPVYAALGASDAVGVGADQPTVDGWVPLVRDGLAPGTQLVNLGIAGATLSVILDEEAPIAVASHPTLVTLWTGTNDLKQGVPLATFSSQLDTLLGRLSADPHTRVVVLNLPDLRLLPAFKSQDPVTLNATVTRWNDAIAAAVRRHGAILVDLYAASPEFARHPNYVSSDGFHPSSAGYRHIADLVLKAIKSHAAQTAP